MVSHWKCLVSSFIVVALYVSTSIAGPQFSKKKISIGNKVLTVEIAQSNEQLEFGLMNRSSLDSNSGMLFIFKNEETRFFWMKNTNIDLDIGFFDKGNILVDIQQMKSGVGVPDSALPSYASAKPAMYALEVNKNWFSANKIKLGAKLTIHR